MDRMGDVRRDRDVYYWAAVGGIVVAVLTILGFLGINGSAGGDSTSDGALAPHVTATQPATSAHSSTSSAPVATSASSDDSLQRPTGPTATSSSSTTATVTTTTTPTTTQPTYRTVSNDLGRLHVEVPVNWGEVDGSDATLNDGRRVPQLTASPDLELFERSFEVAGVQLLVLASDEADDETLDSITGDLGAHRSCDAQGSESFTHGYYTGRIERFACGDGAVLDAIVVEPPEDDYCIVVLIQMISDADFRARDQVIDTFLYEE